MIKKNFKTGYFNTALPHRAKTRTIMFLLLYLRLFNFLSVKLQSLHCLYKRWFLYRPVVRWLNPD